MREGGGLHCDVSGSQERWREDERKMECTPKCTARMLEDASFDPEMISDASKLKVWGLWSQEDWNRCKGDGRYH